MTRIPRSDAALPLGADLLDGARDLRGGDGRLHDRRHPARHRDRSRPSACQAAGQLMAVFALTYAVSSPVLTALTGGFDRRRLLILSMAAFAAANLVAAVAPGYWALVAARVLLAVAAGLYVPSANALAAALAPPARRGRALADRHRWDQPGRGARRAARGVDRHAIRLAHDLRRRRRARAPSPAAGCSSGCRAASAPGLAVASLRERIGGRAPAGGLRGALLVTLLWAVGGYTVYTYIAPIPRHRGRARGLRMSAMRSSYGVRRPSPVSSSAVLPPTGSAGTASSPWPCRPWR